MAALPKHHKLIIYSYATHYEYIVKIRLLNRETRKLTTDSFIGREKRHWRLRCSPCWLCTFKPRHFQAAMVGAETLAIVVEDFVEARCESHSPFKQLLILF